MVEDNETRDNDIPFTSLKYGSGNGAKMQMHRACKYREEKLAIGRAFFVTLTP